MKSILFTFIIAVTTLSHGPALARQDSLPWTEPAFCDLNTFRQLEIKQVSGQLQKLHAYQLGNVVVAGLAVGNSNAQDVIKLASHFSNAAAEDGYCTWYINDGNKEAKKSFNWQYVNRPKGSGAVQEYMSKLGPQLDQMKNNMVACAESKRYLALGCDGMKHRGPTFFGMLLSYAGCSAASANKIVNTIWGTNGIDPKVREAIMQKAFELGQAHPEQSAKLLSQFMGQ